MSIDLLIDVLLQLVSAKTAAAFIVVAMANLALVTAIKQAVVHLHKGGAEVLGNHWVQAALELMQPVLGGILGGYVPEVFPDHGPAMSVLLGVAAGFCAPWIYRRVVKRLIPEALSMPSEERQRRGADPPEAPTDPTG